MNAHVPPQEVLTIPKFLERTEPPARYALWNDGRLLILKHESAISLSTDDLRELRRYFDQFDKGAE